MTNILPDSIFHESMVVRQLVAVDVAVSLVCLFVSFTGSCFFVPQNEKDGFITVKSVGMGLISLQ